MECTTAGKKSSFVIPPIFFCMNICVQDYERFVAYTCFDEFLVDILFQQYHICMLGLMYSCLNAQFILDLARVSLIIAMWDCSRSVYSVPLFIECIFNCAHPDHLLWVQNISKNSPWDKATKHVPFTNMPLYVNLFFFSRIIHNETFIHKLHPKYSQSLWSYSDCLIHDAWRCDSLSQLTHWGREKIAAIFQTTFSNAFSSVKMYEFPIRFHWGLFPIAKLTIFQHWFR